MGSQPVDESGFLAAWILTHVCCSFLWQRFVYTPHERNTHDDAVAKYRPKGRVACAFESRKDECSDPQSEGYKDEGQDGK